MTGRRPTLVSIALAISLCAVSVMSSAGSAAAQAAGNAGRDASDEAAYKDLIRAALSEFDAHRYEEARALFLRAHALAPSARTLRALGNVEFELRHYVQSVHYLRAALASREHALTPEMQTEAQHALTRALAYTGRFALELQPDNAVLSIDGQPATRETDGAVLLDIGRQELVLSAPGYLTQHHVVTVQGGENERVQISLSQGEVASGSTPAGATAVAGATRDDTAPASGSSIFSKWWFWTAVGVVAAGAVTGIAIAASSGTETQAPIQGNLGETRMVLRISP